MNDQLKQCGTCEAPIPGWECRCPECGQASYRLVPSSAGQYADRALDAFEAAQGRPGLYNPALLWSALARAYLDGIRAASQPEPATPF